MSKTQFEMAQDQHTTQIEAQNTLLAIRLKLFRKKKVKRTYLRSKDVNRLIFEEMLYFSPSRT